MCSIPGRRARSHQMGGYRQKNKGTGSRHPLALGGRKAWRRPSGERGGLHLIHMGRICRMIGNQFRVVRRPPENRRSRLERGHASGVDAHLPRVAVRRDATGMCRPAVKAAWKARLVVARSWTGKNGFCVRKRTLGRTCRKGALAERAVCRYGEFL